MSWYCVEERNDSLHKFGRFQRRFLFGENYSVHSCEEAAANREIESDHHVSCRFIK